MIPLTILYDEYIDRPKLTEQKKTQLSIVGVGTITIMSRPGIMVFNKQLSSSYLVSDILNNFVNLFRSVSRFFYFTVLQNWRFQHSQ